MRSGYSLTTRRSPSAPAIWSTVASSNPATLQLRDNGEPNPFHFSGEAQERDRLGWICRRRNPAALYPARSGDAPAPDVGQSLYDDLVAKVTAGTITGNDETLMDSYIAPALVQLAFSEALPFIRVRIVNNGVTVMDSEQSTAATYGDMKPLDEPLERFGLVPYREAHRLPRQQLRPVPALDAEGPASCAGR
jgi:hypothetical protein